jgi:hypothetical protein
MILVLLTDKGSGSDLLLHRGHHVPVLDRNLERHRAIHTATEDATVLLYPLAHLTRLPCAPDEVHALEGLKAPPAVILEALDGLLHFLQLSLGRPQLGLLLLLQLLQLVPVLGDVSLLRFVVCQRFLGFLRLHSRTAIEDIKEKHHCS